MKPRPSSSTNSGTVGDCSMHTPLNPDAFGARQQEDGARTRAPSCNEFTFVYFGPESGFGEIVRTVPKWTATCTHWPVNKAQLDSTADMIKDSKCTWLHCVIDRLCGLEATSAAFKLARQQRRAVGYFMIEMPAALESRADDLLKHELTVKSIRGSVCVISNCHALLTTDVFVLEGERHTVARKSRH